LGIYLLGLLIFPIALLVYRGSQRLSASIGYAIVWWLTAASGVGFAILTAIALRQVRDKNAPFILKDEAIRVGALGCGVILLISVLAALLPVVLDALERRGFEAFVGARHVRASKSGFLTIISILSMAGVGLSSCALCTVRSVMGGFGDDLKHKILDNNAHIVIDVNRPGGMGQWRDRVVAIQAALAKQGGGAATPVVGGEAMGSSASNTAGALVRGIDPDTIGNVIDLKENLEVGKFDYLLHPEKLVELSADEVVGRGPTGEPYLKGPDFKWGSEADPTVREFLKANSKVYPGVIIGRELGKSLHVLVGDEITLLSPIGELGPTGVMPKTRRFRIAGIFYSGMYEYDATHAYVLLSEAQKFFNYADEDRITNIDIRVRDAEEVKDYTAAVSAAVASVPFDGQKGAALRMRDWMEMNKNLFSALKLEKIATFVILSIAIIVASFCIVCTLLLMVTEKGKDIAILKALGASDGAIMRIFMLEGIIIGAIGTVFGVGFAASVCTGAKWFGVRLDPEVYYIDRLPVSVDGRDYLFVAIAAFLICTLATIYPAHAASRISPVEGLRWE
jgi:lipoprotein-releasing system permease protein